MQCQKRAYQDLQLQCTGSTPRFELPASYLHAVPQRVAVDGAEDAPVALSGSSGAVHGQQLQTAVASDDGTQQRTEDCLLSLGVGHECVERGLC